MIVVSIIILAPLVIWGLSLFMHVVMAMSIGGILVIAALIGLFVWLKKRVDAER